MAITPQQQAHYKKLRREHFAKVGADTAGNLTLRNHIPKQLSGTLLQARQSAHQGRKGSSSKPKPADSIDSNQKWIDEYDSHQIRSTNKTEAR